MGKRKKLEKKLERMCTAFASDTLGEYVRVKVDGDFYAMLGGGDYPVEKIKVYVDPYGKYKEEEEIHKGIEEDMYYDCKHTLSFFVASFLHELGHVATMRYFTSEAIGCFELDHEQVDKGLEEEFDRMFAYKMKPQEMLADLWFLKMYLPYNYAEALEFEKKVMKVVKRLRKIKRGKSK